MSNKIFYSFDDFDNDISKLCCLIEEENFEWLYGVPQGGIPLALRLSTESNVPVTVHPHGRVGKVLVVDDIIDSGKTRRKFDGFSFVALHKKKHAEFELEKHNTHWLHETEDWIVYWWEGTEQKSIDDSVIRQLEYIGENPNRDGLKETPARVIKSYQELFSGYDKKPEDIIKTFVDNFDYDEVIALKNIEVYSMCEHHILPFIGKAHVAYLPKDGKVIGISKLARLVDMFSRRLQIQERICQQVTDALMEHLNPLGAACIIEAEHLCMRMRGCNKQNSTMITSSMKGVFRENPAARNELMGLLK